MARMLTPHTYAPSRTLRRFCVVVFAISFGVQAHAQDWVHIESSNGVDRIRIAAAGFKPLSSDPATTGYKHLFDLTLYSDLNSAGIFDLVSQSLAPMSEPGTPAEMAVAQWSAAPASAAMVAFGSLNVIGGNIVVDGWLYDTHNTVDPKVLGQQYSEPASDESTRHIAHEFADEIILRLGGGLPGIAETHIFYVNEQGGNKEIWEMDYDGQEQHQITRLGTITLSPRISPDGNRLAFASLGHDGWNIRVFSMLLGRMVSFPAIGGTNLSPAWSSDGRQIAFSSSRSGDPEIYIGDEAGNNLRRITAYVGPDVSPVWNPRTNSQLAWISGRTGLPQLYIMDSDGTNVQRMTDGGYATSPSWSPNGQFIAFAWDRKYGPGVPGGQDIYVMEVATRKWIQLTHDTGRCDFPSWSPDGRHIVFESGSGKSSDIWTMLADGTGRHKLTTNGTGTMPNWSWR
ncbi:MAG TPA: Tol-Pal system beta propeller repeat protein TolB [Acidobacteriaceae bacterium]|nr:Tol-Pal system beta propeller repeat protein TolB [Acidobacteriaceae bacterium]